MSQGWFKFWRKTLDTDVFRKAEWLQLWAYCLCRANHTTTTEYVKGIATPVRVKPGQFIAGQGEVKKALHSDKSKSTIFRWMAVEFVNRGMLTKKVLTGRCSIWTVCNWDQYQSKRKGKTNAKEEIQEVPAGTGGQEEKPVFPEIPAELEAIWKDWQAACGENGKPLTPTRVKYQLEKLEPHDTTTQLAMIRLAITNRWNDFFPITTKRKPNAHRSRKLGPTPLQQFDEPAPPTP